MSLNARGDRRRGKLLYGGKDGEYSTLTVMQWDERGKEEAEEDLLLCRCCPGAAGLEKLGVCNKREMRQDRVCKLVTLISRCRFPTSRRGNFLELPGACDNELVQYV